MRSRFIAVLIAGVAALSAAQLYAESAPLTDYAKAKEQARKEGKLLVLDFTGSDWCPPCMMLYKEVFGTARFRAYAAKNIVFVEVDFPKGKEQAQALALQNQELAERFGIEAFPSIIVLGSEGKKVGEFLGYQPGGVDAFIAELEKLRKS